MRCSPLTATSWYNLVKYNDGAQVGERPEKSTPGDWQSGQNEYAELGVAEPHKPDQTLRTDRTLEQYRTVFGQELGTRDELILDLGAGDATMADELEELTSHRATVVRFDRDYLDHPPDGEAIAITGDATRMPFANDVFDRVVSHNMMYYLGRDKGAEAFAETLRVLKPGGEAAIFPAKPLSRVDSDIAHTERHAGVLFPTLLVTKPADFSSWTNERKAEVYRELSRVVTPGATLDRLIHWKMARAIGKRGTHRKSL